MQTRLTGSELLTACLYGRPDKLRPFSPGSLSDSAWDDLIRAAAGEFLLPALHSHLSETGFQPPPHIADFLAVVEDLNAERNSRILEELLDIGRLLNGIGLEPVALKGAAFLLAGVYGAPGRRYLCDLDLLVPARSLAAAAKALESAGYQPDTSDSMARFRHHYPQLQRPAGETAGGSAPVELHHSLGHGASRKLLSGAEVLRDSRPVEWNGVRLRIPSEEHLLTHLILHSQIHHTYSERIWPPARAIFDLMTLDRSLSSRRAWDAVRARFAGRGDEATLFLHLLHVHEATGMPLPFEIALGPLLGARRARRRALARCPALRFADPAYLVLSTVARRTEFFMSIVSAPGGLRTAARTLFRPAFYRRLLAEIALR